MNNEFKLRLYKKTGPEKGNLDKELFYDSAKELWTTYKFLLLETSTRLKSRDSRTPRRGST